MDRTIPASLYVNQQYVYTSIFFIYLLSKKVFFTTRLFLIFHLSFINRGGYIVKPYLIEFWQGQTNRLHDRIVFTKPKDGESEPGEFQHAAEGGWVYERLSP